MIPKPTGWTLDTYAAHNEALRAAEEKFQQERDRRYAEVKNAEEKALKVKEEADKAALGLAREIQTYKDEKANELREQIASERGIYATKADLVALGDKFDAAQKPIIEFMALAMGKRAGAQDNRALIAWVLAAIMAFIAIGSFVFGQRGASATPQPQVIVVPAGTPSPGAVQSGPPTQTTR